MLLCDGCDGEVHLRCAGLERVPEGDWLCAACAPDAEGVEDGTAGGGEPSECVDPCTEGGENLHLVLGNRIAHEFDDPEADPFAIIEDED